MGTNWNTNLLLSFFHSAKEYENLWSTEPWGWYSLLRHWIISFISVQWLWVCRTNCLERLACLWLISQRFCSYWCILPLEVLEGVPETVIGQKESMLGHPFVGGWWWKEMLRFWRRNGCPLNPVELFTTSFPFRSVSKNFSGIRLAWSCFELERRVLW